MQDTRSKISVGVPTYNRPELLDRRLANVLSQSLQAIDVIVSDNASNNPEVDRVAKKWQAADARVRYVRQPQNKGAAANFLFVLEASRSEYFIWAADDDRWDEGFLEAAFDGIGDAALFMPTAAVEYLNTGEIEILSLPSLDPTQSSLDNSRRFLKNAQPSIVYGLHRTEVLRENIMSLDMFDMWDVALLFKTIHMGGIKTGTGPVYYAGIPGDVYEAKPASGTSFSYRRLLSSMLRTIAQSRSLSLVEKAVLAKNTTRFVLELAAHLHGAFPDSSSPHHVIAKWLMKPTHYWEAHYGKRE